MQKCQRYLPAFFVVDGTAFTNGCLYANTVAFTNQAFPVQTRVPPTGVTVSGGVIFYPSAIVTSSVGFSNASNLNGELNWAITGGTGGYGVTVRATGGNLTILWTGCEL